MLGVIPARGGSKSVPRKNIRPLAGKPLIAWTITESKKSKYIDRLIVSSDDSDILNVAKKEFDCDTPFIRPADLAQDDTPGVSPILHAIEELPGFDYVVMLQPTSPLRKKEDIDACIEICAQHDVNSCVSVTITNKSPYWMYSLDDSGKMVPLLPRPNGFHRRQSLPKSYVLNGAVYVARTKWLQKMGDFFYDNTRAYVMPNKRSMDIDSDFDFLVCELALSTTHT